MSTTLNTTPWSVKDMVSNQRKVRFTRYFDGAVWYTTENGFEFPVPISDLGNATLLPEDKAILFMRYINSHLKMLQST